MSTLPNEKEIVEARKRETFLKGRLQELYKDEQRLVDQIESSLDKEILAYVEGADPIKARTALTANREQLKFVREAITVCKKEIVDAGEIANAEKLLAYLNDRSKFDRDIVAFMDGDLKPIFAKFTEMGKKFEDLLFKAGQANVGRTNTDFPFLEQNLFSVLHFYLNHTGMPQDLERLENSFSDFFATTRKSAKK